MQQRRARALASIARQARIRMRRGPQAARHALRNPIRRLGALRASATPATLATASRGARRVRQGSSTRVLAKTRTLVTSTSTEFAGVCGQMDCVLDCQGLSDAPLVSAIMECPKTYAACASRCLAHSSLTALRALLALMRPRLPHLLASPARPARRRRPEVLLLPIAPNTAATSCLQKCPMRLRRHHEL